MNELLTAIHRNLTEINVKGQDVFRMAGAIQLLEQAMAISEHSVSIEEECDSKDETTA